MLAILLVRVSVSFVFELPMRQLYSEVEPTFFNPDVAKLFAL